MEKHFDLKVEECREILYKTLNTSGLPMSVLNMLVLELQQTVSAQYIQHLGELRKKEAEEQAKAELENLNENPQ